MHQLGIARIIAKSAGNVNDFTTEAETEVNFQGRIDTGRSPHAWVSKFFRR